MDIEGGGECRQTCHDFDCGPSKPKVQKSFLKGNYQEKMSYDLWVTLDLATNHLLFTFDLV